MRNGSVLVGVGALRKAAAASEETAEEAAETMAAAAKSAAARNNGGGEKQRRRRKQVRNGENSGGNEVESLAQFHRECVSVLSGVQRTGPPDGVPARVAQTGRVATACR